MTLIATVTHTAASRWSLRRACPNGNCAVGSCYAAPAFVVDGDPGNFATNFSVGSDPAADTTRRARRSRAARPEHSQADGDRPMILRPEPERVAEVSQ